MRGNKVNIVGVGRCPLSSQVLITNFVDFRSMKCGTAKPIHNTHTIATSQGDIANDCVPHSNTGEYVDVGEV